MHGCRGYTAGNTCAAWVWHRPIRSAPCSSGCAIPPPRRSAKSELADDVAHAGRRLAFQQLQDALSEVVFGHGGVGHTSGNDDAELVELVLDAYRFARLAAQRGADLQVSGAVVPQYGAAVRVSFNA